MDTQQISLLTAFATALAAVLIAPVVQIAIGFKQASVANISAEAAMKSAQAAFDNVQIYCIQTICISRQKWIDLLRDTLSEFHSIVITENEYPYPKEVDRQLSMLGTKIELLLNPSEVESQKIVNLIHEIYDIENMNERESLDSKFVAAAQIVLRKEWDRIKTDLMRPGCRDSLGDSHSA